MKTEKEEIQNEEQYAPMSYAEFIEEGVFPLSKVSEIEQYGITRREHFTALAMQALIPVVIDRGGAYLLSDDADNGYSVKYRLEIISITAARIADATLTHLYNTQQ